MNTPSTSTPHDPLPLSDQIAINRARSAVAEGAYSRAAARLFAALAPLCGSQAQQHFPPPNFPVAALAPSMEHEVDKAIVDKAIQSFAAAASDAAQEMAAGFKGVISRHRTLGCPPDGWGSLARSEAAPALNRLRQDMINRFNRNGSGHRFGPSFPHQAGQETVDILNKLADSVAAEIRIVAADEKAREAAEATAEEEPKGRIGFNRS